MPRPINRLCGALLTAAVLCVPCMAEDAAATIKVPLPGAMERVGVIRQDDGSYRFRLETDAGPEMLSPDAFAARVHAAHVGRSRWQRLLNITSAAGIAWVALGLGGQILFTGRMLVQWFASERARRSVVPQSFWWMSLAGASMLLVYFAWRKDIVGLMGQATGWFIYIRNIALIRRSGDRSAG